MFYPWGVSSVQIVVGTGNKKTGCRRRNVIKEDLIAEEDEVVKGMASSSVDGPISFSTNGLRRGLAMAGLKWFFILVLKSYNYLSLAQVHFK